MRQSEKKKKKPVVGPSFVEEGCQSSNSTSMGSGTIRNMLFFMKYHMKTECLLSSTSEAMRLMSYQIKQGS
jgi:hypothetical protein